MAGVEKPSIPQRLADVPPLLADAAGSSCSSATQLHPASLVVRACRVHLYVRLTQAPRRRRPRTENGAQSSQRVLWRILCRQHVAVGVLGGCDQAAHGWHVIDLGAAVTAAAAARDCSSRQLMQPRGRNGGRGGGRSAGRSWGHSPPLDVVAWPSSDCAVATPVPRRWEPPAKASAWAARRL